MKRLRLTALSAPILLTLLAVPAASQNREHVQLTGDMRMLQEQTQRLQLVLGSLTEALEAITAQIDEQTNLTRKAFADQKLLVDNLTDDVRVLREKLDDTNVRITSLSEEVEALRLAVPPVQVLPQGTEPTADAADGAPLPRALVAPAAVVPGVSPQRLFDQAMADYMAGQWICLFKASTPISRPSRAQRGPTTRSTISAGPITMMAASGRPYRRSTG